MTLFESLKKHTTVVADTGDIKAIAHHRPQDATTNPSLLYHAAQMPEYQQLVHEATELALERGGRHEEMAAEFIDRLFVVLEAGWLHAGEPRRSVLGEIGGDLDLTHEWKHIGRKPRIEQHRVVDLLGRGKCLGLVEDTRQCIEANLQCGKRSL